MINIISFFKYLLSCILIYFRYCQLNPLYSTFCLSVFFPNVTFGLFSSESQVFSLALGLLIIFKDFRFSFPSYFISLFVLFLLALIFYFDQPSSTSFRSLVSITSFTFVPLASYLVLKSNPNYFKYALSTALSIWTLGVLIQRISGPLLLELFVPDVRTGEGRGFTSFSTEPTQYALTIILVLLFFLLLAHLFEHKAFFIGLILLNLLFSLSTTVFMIITLAFVFPFALFLLPKLLALISFYYTSVSSRVLKISTLLSILFSSAFLFSSNFAPTRIFSLLRFLFSRGFDIFSLVMIDQSVRDRISHPLFSVYSSFNNSFIPFGFISFKPDFIEASRLFGFGDISIGSRMMTGLGSYVYEYGFFSFLFFAAVIHAVFTTKTLTIYFKIFISSAFLLVGFSTVPPGSSLYASFIGVIFFSSCYAYTYNTRSLS